MKKLTYITQLSAVLLLLVQMSSCDKFPSPEPISDKYARPADSISEGMPVPVNGGSIIYSPADKNFRYAASVITNSDGTMSAWLSTAGGSTGSLPSPTDLTSGQPGADAFHGSGESRAIRYEFYDDFYAFSVSVANGGGSNTASVHWALYAWNGNYTQTINETPVAEIDFPNHGDNVFLEINTDNSGYYVATGRSKFIAGTYLLLMTRTAGTPYLWRASEAKDPLLMQGYANGSTTSNIWNCKMQTVSPAESGYSAQIKYFEATTAGPGAVWTSDKEAVAAVVPANNKANRYYAKEPSVIKLGEYYYMAYTGSNTLDEAFDNAVFVVRSDKANAKNWTDWNGDEWAASSPAAVISGDIPSGMEGKYYGAGAPSLVVKDGKIYMYYVLEDSQTGGHNIYLATADANDPNWPSALTEEGMVIDRSRFLNKAMDGVSVVYVEEQNSFLAISGVDIHNVTSTMVVWESADGITGWEYKGVLSANLQVKSKYPRLIRDGQGHVAANTPKYFLYQHGSEFAKAAWMTRMVPYTFAK